MRRSVLFFVCLLGCRTGEETCTDGSPSILVEVRLEDGLAPVGAIEIALATAEITRSETHPFTDSVRLVLSPRPKPASELRVTVRAFEDDAADGPLLGLGEATVRVDPNACNQVTVPVVRGSNRDAGMKDGDAGADPDAGIPADPDGGVFEPDAGVPPVCAAEPNEDTVFLHTFETTSPEGFTDETGTHDGRLEPGPAPVAGPEGCGSALGFVGQGYGVVSSSTAARLETGALDFWVRFDGTPADAQGIISRDATGTTFPGHLTISRNCDDRIVVRIQAENDETAYRCSDAPLVTGEWTHVAVNFGPPDVELLVNGVRATETASVAVCGNTWIDCTAPLPVGIAGNQNPFVYGASSVTSEEGLATPVFAFFVGALDSVRLSATRR